MCINGPNTVIQHGSRIWARSRANRYGATGPKHSVQTPMCSRATHSVYTKSFGSVMPYCLVWLGLWVKPYSVAQLGRNCLCKPNAWRSVTPTPVTPYGLARLIQPQVLLKLKALPVVARTSFWHITSQHNQFFLELASKHNFIKTKNNKSTNFHHNVAIFDHNVSSKHKSIMMKQNIQT
jgi:hypothetical protein